jgi:hypothetical protein
MKDVVVGNEFTVRAFAGKDGKIISRMADGRPVLFGEQYIMTSKLSHGDIVKIRVLKPTPTYILAQPVSLMDESSLEPEDRDQSSLAKTSVAVGTKAPITHALPPQNTNISPNFETLVCPHCQEAYYRCTICKTDSTSRAQITKHIAEAHA